MVADFPGARVKLPLEPEQSLKGWLPQLTVSRVPVESVTVIPLTTTPGGVGEFVLLVILASCRFTVTEMGLPLASVVLHCLARAKHPLGAM